MNIGLGMPTHGLNTRDEHDSYLQKVPAEEMRVVEIAKMAERLGYHSLWFPDHIVMKRAGDAQHPANVSGRRTYPDRPNILETAVAMSAAAAHTSRVKLATGVLIAPYRHPLVVAHQYAGIDVIASGRLIMGVSAGWSRNEFEALGVPYEERGRITDECIEIYRLAWTQPHIEYHGRFFDFADVTVDPKPLQKPCPRIVYGGVTRVGALRAAHYCDGFYPIFLGPAADPARFDRLCNLIRRELEKTERDAGDFQFLAMTQAVITDSSDELARRKPRPNLTGTPEQILADLEDYAAHGYSHCTISFNVRSGTMSELIELIQRFGEDVLPAAKSIRAEI